MITYITAFIFYTLAMVGILLIGFVVYKKTFINAKIENKGIIKVIDTYVIAPKKTLLLVKVKDERFLIASDATSTTFLAKLSSTEEQQDSENIMKEEALQKIIQKMENSPSIKTRFEEENEEKYENEEQNESKKIQKQFMDLYRNTDVASFNAVKKAAYKKDVIQKLLKELSDTKIKTGSRY